MNYPNKIFVCEYKGTSGVDEICKDVLSHFVIVVVAPNSVMAKEHVKEQIGFESEPIWLMGAVHPTLYNSFGTKPLDKQVKILSNNNYHIKLAKHK